MTKSFIVNMDMLIFKAKACNPTIFSEELFLNNQPKKFEINSIKLRLVQPFERKKDYFEEFKDYKYVYEISLEKYTFAYIGILSFGNIGNEVNNFKIKIINETLYDTPQTKLRLYRKLMDSLCLEWVHIVRIDIALFSDFSFTNWFLNKVFNKNNKVKIFGKDIETTDSIAQYSNLALGERCKFKKGATLLLKNKSKTNSKHPRFYMNSYQKGKFKHSYQQELALANGLDINNFYNNEISIYHKGLVDYHRDYKKVLDLTFEELLDENNLVSLYNQILDKMINVENKNGRPLLFIPDSKSIDYKIIKLEKEKDIFSFEKKKITENLKDFIQKSDDVFLHFAKIMASKYSLEAYYNKKCIELGLDSSYHLKTQIKAPLAPIAA